MNDIFIIECWNHSTINIKHFHNETAANRCSDIQRYGWIKWIRICCGDLKIRRISLPWFYTCSLPIIDGSHDIHNSIAIGIVRVFMLWRSHHHCLPYLHCSPGRICTHNQCRSSTYQWRWSGRSTVDSNKIILGSRCSTYNSYTHCTDFRFYSAIICWSSGAKGTDNSWTIHCTNCNYRICISRSGYIMSNGRLTGVFWRCRRPISSWRHTQHTQTGCNIHSYCSHCRISIHIAIRIPI